MPFKSSFVGTLRRHSENFANDLQLSLNLSLRNFSERWGLAAYISAVKYNVV